MTATAYQILICETSWNKIFDYQQNIGTFKAGRYLEQSLGENVPKELSKIKFLSFLLNTKHPRVFAESEVRGDGSDWTLEELRLLGDISIAVPVTVYDNGRHQNAEIHEKPFAGTLIYTPGALLRSGGAQEPADWEEATKDGEIDPEGFYRLCERRLLPAFTFASDQVGEQGRSAFITVPGLGCGQFAGPFHGQMGEHLKVVLLRLLETHREALPNLKSVYFDPYRECTNERRQIGSISFLVRPLTQRNEDKPQLCSPVHYQEEGDDFSNCDPFSIVAWDHVSWPGNDFYAGMRSTDDGVKAAATDSMWKITGLKGQYDPAVNKYQPPAPYSTWEEVVRLNEMELTVDNNLIVY